VPLGGRISYGHLKAVVKACEHFFFHHRSSDPRVIDTSEIDFADRSEQWQEVPGRLSRPAESTQYFLPLGSAGAD
jgi:hypothetical protein